MYKLRFCALYATPLSRRHCMPALTATCPQQACWPSNSYSCWWDSQSMCPSWLYSDTRVEKGLADCCKSWVMLLVLCQQHEMNHLQDATNTQRSPQPQRSHEIAKVTTLLTTVRSPVSPTPTSCGPAVTIVASWDPNILILVPRIATTKWTPSPAGLAWGYTMRRCNCSAREV